MTACLISHSAVLGLHLQAPVHPFSKKCATLLYIFLSSPFQVWATSFPQVLYCSSFCALTQNFQDSNRPPHNCHTLSWLLEAAEEIDNPAELSRSCVQPLVFWGVFALLQQTLLKVSAWGREWKKIEVIEYVVSSHLFGWIGSPLEKWERGIRW